jgi:hypothetical protein
MQFLPIFKNWRFSQLCYGPIFAKTSISLSKKRQICRRIFWRKYY